MSFFIDCCESLRNNPAEMVKEDIDTDVMHGRMDKEDCSACNAHQEQRVSAKCPKCAEDVLGDEDAICGNCLRGYIC